MRKIPLRIIGLLLMAYSPPAGADTPVSVPYATPDLVVVGHADIPGGLDFSDDSAASLAGKLPGVALNSQGGPGGQSDLSIRGSAFSGAGFSVNGLSLGCAQTEHFNADLPLSPSLFSVPTVQSGFDQAMHTEGHLVGTVSLRLKPVADGTELSAGVGEYESYRVQGLAAETLWTAPSGGRLGMAAFGGYDRFNHVNYDDNNNQNALGGGLIQWVRQDVQLDTVAGYQKKRFGARGYYGTNPDDPADEQTQDFLLLSSVRKGNDEQYVRAAAAFRDFQDDYNLYMPATRYHNDHETETVSAQVGGHQKAGDSAGTVWRVSADQEELISESLGNHRRSHGALTLIPDYRMSNWLLAAGVRQEVFEREKPATLPQAGITWDVTEGQSLQLSAGRSVRQPSYTELNYESPASLGNQGLDNQFSDTVELNWTLIRDCWSIRGGPFFRRTRDTVDWVRPTPESTRWLAENIGTVDTAGADASMLWMLRDDLQIQADGAWLDQEGNADLYSSRYALDYARVLAHVDVEWMINRCWSCALTQGYRHQAENPLREHGNDQWLAAVRVGFRLPKWSEARLNCSVENLWDDHFEEFPGQDTATGRRVYAGLEIRF